MLYVVRHGQTDWNKEKRIQGWQDIPLNATGIEEAYVLKEKLKGISFDYVFASPLKRALKTAQILTDAPIIKDERIKERGNGLLETHYASEIPLDLDFGNPQEKRFNIEPVDVFQKRIFAFLDDIRELCLNHNVLVVTHAGAALNIAVYFRGEPLNHDLSIYKLNNCEYVVYDYNLRKSLKKDSN